MGVGFPLIADKSIEGIQFEEAKTIDIGYICRENCFCLLEIRFEPVTNWRYHSWEGKTVGEGYFTR